MPPPWPFPTQPMPSFGVFLAAFLAAGLLGTLVFGPLSEIPHAPLNEFPSRHGGVTFEATRKQSPSEHGGAIMFGAIKSAIRRIAEPLTSPRVEEKQRCLDELQRLRKWQEGEQAAGSAAQNFHSKSPATSASATTTITTTGTTSSMNLPLLHSSSSEIRTPTSNAQHAQLLPWSASAAAAIHRGPELPLLSARLHAQGRELGDLHAAIRSLLTVDERRTEQELTISSTSSSGSGGSGSGGGGSGGSGSSGNSGSGGGGSRRRSMQRHLDAPPATTTPASASAAAGEPASVRRMLSHTYRTPNLNPNAACAENETSVAALRAHLAAKAVQLRATQVQIEEMQRTVGRVNYQKFLLDYALSETTVDWNDRLLPPQRMEDARRAINTCTANGVVVTTKKLQLWKGYACDASDDDIYSFLEYDPNRLCPDDWMATQALIFTHNCFALPKRRCMARTNQRWTEPLPFPAALFTQGALKDENVRWSLHSCDSFTCLNTRAVGDSLAFWKLPLPPNRLLAPAAALPSSTVHPKRTKGRERAVEPAFMRVPLPFPAALFTQSALKDENVRWSLHSCKSFTCLNTRVVGDCRNCFNLTLEKNRWQRGFRGSLPIAYVIKLKRGSLRLGLDAGGGTGTFAAHMALYNVTILTTAMNVETVAGRTGGLPYMETLAHRGLIPLWLPHKARLPLFDNTLDLVHCVNSIKYLPVLEFEELIFEWDRVLRVGGVMWFEMFYAPLDEMPLYIAIIEQLQYKKLHWNITPKPDSGERKGMHIYLNCVIEKPVRRDR
ncbi:unnamed protein product [Closterium sp. NIES-54]